MLHIELVMYILLVFATALIVLTKPPSALSLLGLMCFGGLITLMVLCYGFDLDLVPIIPT